jgi:hypothetical protein
MKIRDIVEQGYGDNDEVGPAATKASQRAVVTTNGNLNKRANNQNANANAEVNIANTNAQRDQNRDQRRIPTGQPNRAAYDAMRTDLYNRRGIKQQ